MFDALLNKFAEVIINPLITLVFGAAVLVFIVGIVQYLLAQNDPGARETGARHILWGVVGMAIMISAYGIINFVAKTISGI